jgi:hypothetical protein
VAFVDLNSIHNPVTGSVAPATWGDGVRDNFVDLDARTAPTTTATNTATGTTASTTFTATLGGSPGTNPAVTVTTGTVAVIHLRGAIFNSAAGNTGYIGVAVSGATTRAANDGDGISFTAPAAAYLAQFGTTLVLTGLTAGSNTFTLQYRVNAGTGSFFNRAIAVEPGNKLA